MRHRLRTLQAPRAVHGKIPNSQITREDEIRLYNVESDMTVAFMREENFEEIKSYMEKCHDQYKI